MGIPQTQALFSSGYLVREGLPNAQAHGGAAVVRPTALPPPMARPSEQRNYPSKFVCTQLVLKLAGSISDFTIDNSSALLGAICRFAQIDMSNVRQVYATSCSPCLALLSAESHLTPPALPSSCEWSTGAGAACG
jgi:hypothetical protein